MNYLQLPTAILPHLRRLSGVQLGIWADAYTWGQNGKECRRSNAQFGEMFGVSSKSASDAINGLRKHGMIDWDMDAKGRVLRATIPGELPPSRQTSTLPSNVYPPVQLLPPSRSTSTPPPVERVPPLPSNFHQIEKVIEKRKEKRIEKREIGVLMPFDSERFSQTWEVWKEYKRVEKRFRYKSPVSEQEALSKIQKLSNHDEQTAIEIIQQSIANGWAGFFPLRNHSGISQRDAPINQARTLEWANK